MRNNKEYSMGVDTKDYWVIGMVDLDCICHFWESMTEDGRTVLCNEYGDVIYVAKVPYGRFKKIFLDYKCLIINSENN